MVTLLDLPFSMTPKDIVKLGFKKLSKASKNGEDIYFNRSNSEATYACYKGDVFTRCATIFPQRQNDEYGNKFSRLAINYNPSLNKPDITIETKAKKSGDFCICKKYSTQFEDNNGFSCAKTITQYVEFDSHSNINFIRRVEDILKDGFLCIKDRQPFISLSKINF